MIAFYLDPGTGSALVSSVIALAAVGFYMLKGFIYREFRIGSSAKVTLDPSVEYGLVFYSEGRQYWNTFKPIVEELSRRGIEATYVSGDEADPGLSADLPSISVQYIGNTRETYYFLSNLKARMVVMTTPGLNVLQIKRSKDVQHYCHITHSAAGAEYKTYGMDYYDSVLVGGTGDLEWIRALEEARGDEPKIIEEIGCTYLDVMRASLKSEEEFWFEEEKPVVLVSPTWGSHGLLSRYGKAVLQALTEDRKYNIIVRPHPQSFIAEGKLMEELQTTFPDSSNLRWDRRNSGLEAMGQADVMVSDFSGIIFDFLFLFKKPILTFKGIFDKRGRDAMDVDREPWNLEILDRIGRTLGEEDLPHLSAIISATLQDPVSFEASFQEAQMGMDRYPGESGRRGADFIERTLNTLPRTKEAISKPVSSEPQGWTGKIRMVVSTLFDPSFYLEAFFALLLFYGYLLVGKQILVVDGFNYKFVTQGLPWVTRVLPLPLIGSLALIWIRERGACSFVRTREPFSLKELWLLLFPMAPITQYVIANQDILLFGDSIAVLGFFLALSFSVVILVPHLLTPLTRKHFTVTIGLALAFHLLNMANFIGIFGMGRKRIQVPLFLAIALMIFVLYGINKKSLYVFSVLFFAVTLGSAVYSTLGIGEERVTTHSGKVAVVAGRSAQKTPDVYLLIYDSYPNEETLEFYGIDNRQMYESLLEKGFAIYDGTYSVGPISLESMSHVFDFEKAGWSTNLRKILAQDANGLKIFKEAGYTNHSIMPNDYMVRGVQIDPAVHDSYFPNPEDGDVNIKSSRILISAISEGVFRFDAAFGHTSGEEFIREKRQFLGKRSEQPRFLYTHVDRPGHTTDIGVLADNETELWEERLRIANGELEDDLAVVLEHNPDALIIVAADHGPYLTKNGKDLNVPTYSLGDITRYDVQDRYGTLLAIRWPEKGYETRYDIRILQDVLPAVFAYLYDDEALFDRLRMERKTLYPYVTGGVVVEDGIVIGGADDGRPLFDRVGIRVLKDR
ncbi:MAG TPA: CDP-glycerol glycerophosphotransferase family protein [Sphaerochaeta sp.]|nr:CDP-glycerol glycerophosphotransferase family protein [Spirochaetota bacterium]HQB06152.1 CDP-glycerol glycerophosphotransferase family protein [Sphaerochaeta sp.]